MITGRRSSGSAPTADAHPADAGPGVLPEDAEHPVAAAAVTVLSGQPLADVTGTHDLGEVSGYWVRPDGASGRPAVGWGDDGKLNHQRRRTAAPDPAEHREGTVRALRRVDRRAR
ncbi:hypothetical protein ACVW0K_007013 [Streptomyces filamentosus]